LKFEKAHIFKKSDEGQTETQSPTLVSLT